MGGRGEYEQSGSGRVAQLRTAGSTLPPPPHSPLPMGMGFRAQRVDERQSHAHPCTKLLQGQWPLHGFLKPEDATTAALREQDACMLCPSRHWIAMA